MMLKGFEKHLHALKGAIHVGANIGEERDWYVNQNFSKVLWFEPNRELFWKLEENIKHLPNHFAYNFGIHDYLKTAALHISNNAGQSSSILELGTHAFNHPEVHFTHDAEIQLRRLDWVVNALGVSIDDFNFLNIDVQGVELNVIKSAGKLIEKFDYIYTEVNEEEVYKGCSLIGEIDAYLAPLGFVRAETIITRAKWGDALYIKK